MQTPKRNALEMTRAEFAESWARGKLGFAARANRKIGRAIHCLAIEEALADGVPIRPDILADYPKLAAAAAERCK